MAEARPTMEKSRKAAVRPTPGRRNDSGAGEDPRAADRKTATAPWPVAAGFRYLLPVKVKMSRSFVSGTKNRPMTKVIAAKMIGYQRPA